MPGTLSIPVGGTKQLVANITTTTPGAATDTRDMTWTNSNTAAVVFTAGRPAGDQLQGATTATLRGVAPGTVTITVTMGAFSDFVTVSVSAAGDVNVSALAITF
jgi:uncharacterized protein YjdB